MSTYRVWFTKYWEYEVEAETDEEAEDLAYEMFCSSQMCPVADTTYDEIEVEEIEGDGD